MGTETTTAATATTAAATTTTAAATTTTAAAATTAAPAAFDWKGAGVDDVGIATVTAKGWKAPNDLLGSYVNLEKLVGAPPEQIIKLPKDITPESMAPVYDRLGRPKTAAEYKLPVPEGADPKFAEIAGGKFHELGLSASQALKLTEWWNGTSTEATKAQLATYTKSVETDKVALRTEWGDKHDANVALAQQAATAFGMDAKTVSALERAMGFAATMKFMHSIGSKVGEAEFVQGGGRRSEFGGLTPESAKAQIAALHADRGFVAKFNHADPVIRSEAQKEMERLNKIAYPGVVTL